MSRTYYKHGDYNAICDVCGFKFKGSQLKKRWDGMRVCEEDWEMRHPMDLFNPDLSDDEGIVDDPRPEQPDVFTDVTYITPDP